VKIDIGTSIWHWKKFDDLNLPYNENLQLAWLLYRIYTVDLLENRWKLLGRVKITILQQEIVRK